VLRYFAGPHEKALEASVLVGVSCGSLKEVRVAFFDTRAIETPLNRYSVLGSGSGPCRQERHEARMPVIKIRDTEPFEVAMKRFKKQCEKAGILSELKRREYYDKPSIRKKKKAAAARKRAIKKQRRMAR